MPLSLRNRLHVGVSPAGAAVVVSAGFRNRVVHQALWSAGTLPQEALEWTPAIDALRKQLVPRFYNAGSVSITLSDHFCRYALLPNSAALTRDAELAAYAQHRMRASFGDDVDKWELRLNRHRDAVLVCAVERELLEALRAVFGEQHLAVKSIQPHFAYAFNRHRNRVHQRSGWFVVQEPGKLVISRFDDGRWTALSARRTADDSPQGVMAALERERRLHASPEEVSRNVWLVTSLGRYSADELGGHDFDVTVLHTPIPALPQVEEVPDALAA